MMKLLLSLQQHMQFLLMCILKGKSQHKQHSVKVLEMCMSNNLKLMFHKLHKKMNKLCKLTRLHRIHHHIDSNKQFLAKQTQLNMINTQKQFQSMKNIQSHKKYITFLYQSSQQDMSIHKLKLQSNFYIQLHMLYKQLMILYIYCNYCHKLNISFQIEMNLEVQYYNLDRSNCLMLRFHQLEYSHNLYIRLKMPLCYKCSFHIPLQLGIIDI